jgi:hypothetical protein
VKRPEKITFAEMRSSGVRGLLIYCSDYRCSHYITSQSAAIDGRMMFGCLISSPGSFARHAASEAPISDPIGNRLVRMHNG